MNETEVTITTTHAGKSGDVTMTITHNATGVVVSGSGSSVVKLKAQLLSELAEKLRR